METKFKPLIDDRNEDLWEEMNQAYSIEVKEAEEPGYLSSIDGKDVRIEVDMDNLNPHSFTHELLHLYLKTKEVLISRDLKDSVDQTKSLSAVFSDSLKELLGNCLEHSKMLPLYLDRGYKNELFVRDYDQKIMNEEELQELQESYLRNGMYSRDAIDKYIGRFFSMKTSNNPQYNYNYYYLGLEKIDLHLYRCLERFWEEWQTFKVGDPREEYQAMLKRLMENLLNWKQDKTLV